MAEEKLIFQTALLPYMCSNSCGFAILTAKLKGKKLCVYISTGSFSVFFVAMRENTKCKKHCSFSEQLCKLFESFAEMSMKERENSATFQYTKYGST
jgi:hypothetical protein